MTLEERIVALGNLGDHLLGEDEYLEAVIQQTYLKNLWFTTENTKKSIRAIATEFLNEKKLRSFAAHYKLDDNIKSVRVGLIMAGNIPLVGFHDFLCVFLCGHHAMVKLSEKDAYLFPYFVKLLDRYDDRASSIISVVNKLSDFDAVIATGSNNSARYFNSYFEKYPHIIRKNRNSIAVLDGKESPKKLDALAHDILNYFGLGCRNVSKIYIPKDYDFNPLMETIHEYKKIILHGKYKNNFDYNFAIASLNSQEIVMNGCLILLEDTSLTSRIASLHYEFYEDRDVLNKHLNSIADQIQCLVATDAVPGFNITPFGKTQEPGLYDYADGVDTVNMLLSVG